MTKVSVIVPVYNAEKYLAVCIESILGQTLSELEIILINDGSTDGSIEIIKRYAQKDKRIKYATQLNQGPSAARNRGIGLAAGKYIAFVDSDDWVEQEMYETMYTVAEKYKLNMVMCNYINDYGNRPSHVAKINLPAGKVLNKDEIKDRIWPELFKDACHNSSCNKIFQREFIVAINNHMVEGLHYGEDLIFMLQVFDQLEEMYFVNQSFYHYTHRESNSLTKHRDENFYQVLCYMYNVRKNYARKWGLPLLLVAEPFIYYILMDLVQSMENRPLLQKRRHILTTYLHAGEVREGLRLVKVSRCFYTWKLKILLLLLKLKLVFAVSLMTSRRILLRS